MYHYILLGLRVVLESELSWNQELQRYKKVVFLLIIMENKF